MVKGASPLADACDYARFCSALDFWSINDHAEASTPRKWLDTKKSIQQCNNLSEGTDDLVSFLGWEWTQVDPNPGNHYGHKNVIFLETDDALGSPKSNWFWRSCSIGDEAWFALDYVCFTSNIRFKK
jgi:hypothetical protein